MTDKRDLLDSEGENRAVRSFLMAYSCDRSITVGEMRKHMDRSGWPMEYRPEFARDGHDGLHLTKAMAQEWLRHLFSMEPKKTSTTATELIEDLTVFHMGLGFALCHRDEASTRYAIKDLKDDFSTLRKKIEDQLSQPEPKPTAWRVLMPSGAERGIYSKWSDVVTAIAGLEGNVIVPLVEAQPSDDKFCDSHCTWRDHHPECVRADKQPPTVTVTDNYSVDGHNDEIDAMLPVGTELYTAPPVQADDRIQKARESAMHVFKDSCNHTHQAIDYMVEVLKQDEGFTADYVRVWDEPKPTVPLAHTRTNRIYVAGPMTDIPDLNFPAFNAMAAKLRERGWYVVNPAEHGIVEGATWEDYMHYDIQRIATCCAVYMLPGWEKSRGAKVEHAIARALNMEVIYDPEAETGR